MRSDDDRIYPPGVVPAAVGALGALALAVLAGLALVRCAIPEPVQMIPNYPKTSDSSAIATASAQAGGIQRIRVTIPQNQPKPALDVAPQGPAVGGRGQSVVLSGPSPNPSRIPGKAPSLEASNGAGSGAIVIEFEQAITSAATASAQASASESPYAPAIPTSSHGRLGIIAATMPGILAADLQVVRIDASPVTRWLVDMPMELGVDTIVNLDAIGSGVTVGSKGFVGLYGWNRWDRTAGGLALGAGLRF